MAKTAPLPTTRTIPTPPVRGVARTLLLIGFGFAVMADPVSSVAYTIEASLRALHGHLGLLLATQLIVLGIIALVDVNYWQLVGRLPLGALIVDFVLTITISIAAAVSAVIAYVPALASERILLGLLLLVAVAGLTWFGHGGRLAFA